MSDRERWIVYPLLLLTLGVAMRDKLTRTIEADHILCRDIFVVDGNGKPMLLVGGVYKEEGKWSPAPTISVIGSDDKTKAQLGSNVQCGNVITTGNVIAAGRVQATKLHAVSLVDRKRLVALGAIQAPLMMITDLGGKPVARIDYNGFQQLPRNPSKAPESKSPPGPQDPKQNPRPQKEDPTVGRPPEPAEKD